MYPGVFKDKGKIFSRTRYEYMPKAINKKHIIKMIPPKKVSCNLVFSLTS